VPTVSEELERLFSLDERGAITREEYERQEAALLGSPSEAGQAR